MSPHGELHPSREGVFVLEREAVIATWFLHDLCKWQFAKLPFGAQRACVFQFEITEGPYYAVMLLCYADKRIVNKMKV